MFFKKYNVVIFKDPEGGFRNVNLRGGIGFILGILVLALIALNFYLWEFHSKNSTLERELKESQRIILDQDSQILALATRIEDFSSSLERVQKFDAQLRVLLNIDKDISEVEVMGEKETEYSGTLTRLTTKPQVLMQHRELFAHHTLTLVEDLTRESALEEVSQQELILFLRANKESLMSMPSIWPASGRLTSGFGYRWSPITGKKRLHQGIDIGNKVGVPIVATARAVVTFAGWDGAYGKSIILDHGNNIITRYAHMSNIVIEKGQTVQRGQVIGAMGNTGRSTGSHLHYEVRVGGVPTNPMRYILN